MTSETKPMLLVLDLDQTLIYSCSSTLGREPDFVDAYNTYWRPGVHAFLDNCLREFDEVGVWTASTRDYAEPILDALGFLDRFKFVWCRERCTMCVPRAYDPWSLAGEPYELLKPIQKLMRRGYDKKKIVFVDDSPEVVRRSYGNLVRVVPFIGDTDDQELSQLFPYLMLLNGQQNVRTIDKRGWRSHVQQNQPAPPEG